jgi:hypothetical protein
MIDKNCSTSVFLSAYIPKTVSLVSFIRHTPSTKKKQADFCNSLSLNIRLFLHSYSVKTLNEKIVIPTRFERVAHSLEGCCSIQLSYGTIFLFCGGKNTLFYTFKQPLGRKWI